MGLCYALVSVWPWFLSKSSNTPTPEALAAMPDSAVPLKPGPWGNLEALPMYIEPPDEYLPTRMVEEADRRWCFRGFTQNQLLALFQSADLTAQQRAELSDISKWQQDQNAIYVTPTRDLILALSPKARKQIYSPMLADPSTLVYKIAFSCPAAKFGDFFAQSGLSDETIGLIRQLSYPYGKLILFCDMPLVLDTLPASDQKTRLVKTLFKKPTLLLRLHVTPDSDLDELEHYWIRAGGGLDLRPLFESLAKLPHGARISLTALLPPIPAADIYTYPFPSLNLEDQHKDCRWTALNFFRYVPDDRFTDNNAVLHTLLTDYYPALSDPRYGDLVLLSTPKGDIIHIAVYIAADIVYTKNSGSFRDPYILMNLSDMMDHFSSQIPEDQTLRITIYRNKYY
ncbi:MAG TPA: hypothetical protein VGZ93_12310 [Candidatus Methylacidiphilales bacterium]|nr:hypothetical protein [Candidatus Methylacidiphilales bacterium]